MRLHPVSEQKPDLALQLLDELKKVIFEGYAKVKQMYVKELESYEAMISTLEVISNRSVLSLAVWVAVAVHSRVTLQNTLI